MYELRLFELNQASQEQNFRCYPNPVVSRIHVDFVLLFTEMYTGDVEPPSKLFGQTGAFVVLAFHPFNTSLFERAILFPFYFSKVSLTKPSLGVLATDTVDLALDLCIGELYACCGNQPLSRNYCSLMTHESQSCHFFHC